MTKKINRNRSKSKKNKNKTVRISSKLLLIIAALAIIIVAVFVLMETGSIVQAGLPRNVNVDKAYELRQSGIFVLDVREVHEWETVHIPGSTLIPLGELDYRLSELPKDEKILVVCRSGNRSVEARDTLLDAGFKNVTSLNGGIIEWVNRSYDVVYGED